MTYVHMSVGNSPPRPRPPKTGQFRRTFVPHPIHVQLEEVAYSFASSVLSLAHSICSLRYRTEHR